MSYRDKSQGFGFVYVDIQKLLAQKNMSQPVMDTKALSINLNKDPIKPQMNPSAQVVPPTKEITQNLDRLTALHQKLHVLMEELDTLTKKKKS
ncbi:MAG: hypothetical protein HYR96_15430 [Deltaproteobacteria bacterium]|nr:hypothetical protein [Deltaproteobacteria bacterium]MBI3294512.1 hypothetical protein [Deltaproteobacteria bacterium]